MTQKSIWKMVIGDFVYTNLDNLIIRENKKTATIPFPKNKKDNSENTILYTDSGNVFEIQETVIEQIIHLAFPTNNLTSVKKQIEKSIVKNRINIKFYVQDKCISDLDLNVKEIGILTGKINIICTSQCNINNKESVVGFI